MAENLGTAILSLETSDKGLDKGLDAAERKTEGWAGRVGGVLKGGLLVGAGVVAAAGVGLVKVLGDSANAAMDAERTTALLKSTLISTGGASGKTQQSIEALSLSLSEVVPIEDDVITGAQTMLLTFKNVTGDTFDRATLAILDMATAMNKGAAPSAEQLQSTTIQLGKALNDPIAGMAALGRVGVQFSDEQKAAIKAMVETNNLAGAQALILKEVESQFGGAAKAAGSTFAGQLQIMNNALGNVKEEIGMALLPVLSDLIKEYGPALIAFAKDAAKWIVSDLVPAIKVTVQWIAENLVPAIQTVVEWAVVNLVPAIQDIARWIVNDLVPAVVLVVQWLVENLGPIIRDVARWIVTDFVPAVQAIVKWLSVNLPPAIDFAGRVFNDLKARIDGITSAIRTAIQWVSDLIERLRNLRMPNLSGGLNLGLGGANAQGGLALAGAGMQSTNNIVINAPGGDPQRIKTAVIDGLATARARGLR